MLEYICEYSVANKLVINISVPVTFPVQILAEETNYPKISLRPSHIRRVFASKRRRMNIEKSMIWFTSALTDWSCLT